MNLPLSEMKVGPAGTLYSVENDRLLPGGVEELTFGLLVKSERKSLH